MRDRDTTHNDKEESSTTDANIEWISSTNPEKFLTQLNSLENRINSLETLTEQLRKLTIISFILSILLSSTLILIISSVILANIIEIGKLSSFFKNLSSRELELIALIAVLLPFSLARRHFRDIIWLMTFIGGLLLVEGFKLGNTWWYLIESVALVLSLALRNRDRDASSALLVIGSAIATYSALQLKASLLPLYAYLIVGTLLEGYETAWLFPALPLAVKGSLGLIPLILIGGLRKGYPDMMASLILLATVGYTFHGDLTHGIKLLLGYAVLYSLGLLSLTLLYEVAHSELVEVDPTDPQPPELVPKWLIGPGSVVTLWATLIAYRSVLYSMNWDIMLSTHAYLKIFPAILPALITLVPILYMRYLGLALGLTVLYSLWTGTTTTFIILNLGLGSLGHPLALTFSTIGLLAGSLSSLKTDMNWVYLTCLFLTLIQLMIKLKGGKGSRGGQLRTSEGT